MPCSSQHVSCAERATKLSLLSTSTCVTSTPEIADLQTCVKKLRDLIEKSDAMLYAPSLNEVELVGIFSEQQLAGTQPACTIAAPHSLSLTRLNASRPCGHQRPPRRQTEPLQCQPEQIMETSLQPSVTRAQPDIPAQPLQFEPSNSTTTICEPPAASHSGLTVKTCR
ncbi:uncharacterized protein LOC114475878 isoform X3 [Gouania willdenowi]|uniref:uncharacterized protein LOC114475878 isoform X3 n=1 Tax=Gouania willdenowi TaxID=441366 RepID=UPI00105499BE|nr:uncharacterized protein LOC114475878 isoform X3 [Gouania willdenowi]